MSDSLDLPDRLLALLDDLPADQLAFAPVPVKSRRDGWSPARQRGFIHRLALCGCVPTAARCVGMSRESAYRLRARPGGESFAAAWDKALGWGEQRATDRALERALCGEMRPIFYRGRRVGERLVHDTRLTIAVLERSARRDRQDPSPPRDPMAILRAFRGKSPSY